MADKNDNNKYVLLMHHNPQVKTIEDFMDSEHIYEVDDEGYVLPNSQASDSFFDFNKDFIWEQMSEFDKERVKEENGSYPKSSADLKKTNTLPCPCKIKVKSADITAEIAVNATNVQENTSDVYAFESEKIQELYQDEGFVADESTKREITCNVFGWFKSLYYAYTFSNKASKAANRERFSEFANLSKHVISLSTNVGPNGGSFSLKLPVINTKKATSDLFVDIKDLGYSAYVGRGRKDEYSFDNRKSFYAKNEFDSIEGNYYNWLISNNDLLFISFEKLKMETNRSPEVGFIGDDDNFDIKTAIANGVYDMIGLVDSVRVVAGANSSEAYVEVTGRDLMKLLIDDGSWFFNTSTVANPSSVFANNNESGDIRDVVSVSGYNNPPIKRMRRDGGEIDIFSNQLDMKIAYILKGVLSQLINVEVVPGFVFQSWGEDRTKYTDYQEK